MYRHVRFLGIGASIVATTALVFGCGSSRSVLYSGVSPLGHKRVVTDVAAVRDARLARSQWVSEIARRGREAPSERFANLSARQLRRRLAQEAARYDFTVKKIQLLHPRQAAPLIVITTRHYVAFAHAVPDIENALDPHIGHSDQAGWAFEGFFLEAQDERGVPFLGAFNFERGSDLGGGQWARSEQLYPFSHG